MKSGKNNIRIIAAIILLAKHNGAGVGGVAVADGIDGAAFEPEEEEEEEEGVGGGADVGTESTIGGVFSVACCCWFVLAVATEVAVSKGEGTVQNISCKRVLSRSFVVSKRKGMTRVRNRTQFKMTG